MSNKQIVEDLLRQLPDAVSLHEIADRIEFVAAIQQGISELDRGLEIPLDEVERDMPSWLIK